MDDLFGDERLQFYLRNRADIKTWAAIESDAIAATRELLARAQPVVGEAFAAIEPTALVRRHDSGPWERIFVQRDGWPPGVGLALEWHREVDPLSNAPKIGVFWWADPPTLVDPRSRLGTVVDRNALQKLGYKVPMSGVWPVGAYVKSGPDWWRDPEAWIAGIAELLVAAWPLVAPHIDEVLVGIWPPPELPPT
jgi:hypothetical protein